MQTKESLKVSWTRESVVVVSVVMKKNWAYLYESDKA